MSGPGASIPPAEALALAGLVTPTPGGVASRVLAKASGGNLTLFAFDAGQGLEEHSTPFDALVMVLEGALRLTIGGASVDARPGSVVLMPGGLPHALLAPEATRMLLVTLREIKNA